VLKSNSAYNDKHYKTLTLKKLTFTNIILKRGVQILHFVFSPDKEFAELAARQKFAELASLIPKRKKEKASSASSCRSIDQLSGTPICHAHTPSPKE
jgi:hypothetical protein